jgi:hypothetical protein
MSVQCVGSSTYAGGVALSVAARVGKDLLMRKCPNCGNISASYGYSAWTVLSEGTVQFAESGDVAQVLNSVAKVTVKAGQELKAPQARLRCLVCNYEGKAARFEVQSLSYLSGVSANLPFEPFNLGERIWLTAEELAQAAQIFPLDRPIVFEDTVDLEWLTDLLRSPDSSPSPSPSPDAGDPPVAPPAPAPAPTQRRARSSRRPPPLTPEEVLTPEEIWTDAVVSSTWVAQDMAAEAVTMPEVTTLEVATESATSVPPLHTFSSAAEQERLAQLRRNQAEAMFVRTYPNGSRGVAYRGEDGVMRWFDPFTTGNPADVSRPSPAENDIEEEE